MTRISSLFVAISLAILPVAAFAQQTVDAAKTAAPASMTTAPATVATTTKSDVKTPAAGAKTEVHSMTHHSKTVVPTKAVEPTKS